MQLYRSNKFSFRGFTILLISVILFVLFYGYSRIFFEVGKFGVEQHQVLVHAYIWLIPTCLLLGCGLFIGSDRKPKYL